MLREMSPQIKCEGCSVCWTLYLLAVSINCSSSFFFTNAVTYCWTVAASTIWPFIYSYAKKHISSHCSQMDNLINLWVNKLGKIQITLVPVFIVPGSAIIPFISSIGTARTQPCDSIISIVDMGNYKVEDKIILLFVVDACQRSSKRRTLVPDVRKIIQNLKMAQSHLQTSMSS